MTIRFKLYNSDGITLRYTFLLVQETNMPKTLERFTEIKGTRGIGSIIITGSGDSWDGIIRGFLVGDDYEEITQKIDALETAIEFAEPYYLKIDKVEGGASTYSYRVKRLEVIEYPASLRNSNKKQEYLVRFKIKSW